MEGASWMCDKIGKEYDRHSTREKALIDEYKERVEEAETPEALTKIREWLSEVIDVSQLEHKEVIANLKDNSEYH